jgi:branched-chain amino acid transport system ATP-binding protein
MAAILEVRNLSKTFGGIIAVDGVSFDVQPGEILAVIGPNGAGKTTLFNLISGLYPPTSGEVTLNGHALNGLKSSQRAELGLARTFQNLHMFENMTVLENVMVGRQQRFPYGLIPAALRLPHVLRAEKQMRADALALLERIGLAGRADELIGNLPFGQQRLVQIVRALAGEPRIILLDEPAAGLTRGEINALDDLIRDMARQGITVLIVEHDVPLVMGLAQRVMVLNFGEKIADGNPTDIQHNPEVIAAYLGEKRQLPALNKNKALPVSETSQPLLKVSDLSAYYGSLCVLNHINLQVAKGEIVAVIGANGAGKTTFLNTLVGLLTPRSGSITLDGQNITGWSTEAAVTAGVSLVPERRQIFTTLTVRDNLLLGAYKRRKSSAELEDDLKYIYDVFPILKERERQPGGTLSGGEQQMLAVGRGLMSRPRLLIVDEPSVGLAPILVREILRVLAELREHGTTVLLIEQNAQAALDVADRAYVFENGRLVLEGSAAELCCDERVQRVYLGGG